MQKLIIAVTIFFSTCCAWARWEGCYRLYLADKEGSDYCALSERALQRRDRQGIALDDADLCVSPKYKQALRDGGWQIVTESRWLNTVVVRRPDEASVEDEFWTQFPFVTRAQQVTGGDDLPSIAAPKLRQELHLPIDNLPKDDFRRPVHEVHGESLYENGFRGEGMLVAVLDGGFMNLKYYSFLMEKVVGWYDCYDPMDAEGTALWNASTHGTHVLSIMATDSVQGVWGTAPEARYFVIRTEWEETETPLEEEMWVRGAEIADSIGADLINSSLGYATFDHAAFNHCWEDLSTSVVFVSQGAAMACQKGILVCNSAGNERQKAWQTINFPADEAQVFTIGATDINLEPAVFTSTGWLSPCVKPDVSCRGANSWHINSATGNPTKGSGTSYSCPMMCGLMASLWSADTSRSPEELRQIVRESASQSASPDSLIGYGLPDFRVALSRVRPDVNDIETLCPDAVQERIYDLQGQIAKRKGLCIYRRKIVFVR